MESGSLLDADGYVGPVGFRREPDPRLVDQHLEEPFVAV